MIDNNFYTFSNFIKNKISFLSPSEEDYLEMIYRLHIKTNSPVRVSSLANHLKVKPSSATKMIKKLSSKELIFSEKYGHIYFLDKGLELGEFLIYRHNTLEKFLNLIKPNINITYEVEKIEHTISSETLNKLKILLDFFENNQDILDNFNKFLNIY